MASTGLSPSHAIPAAKVTECCSAMATSKKRSGNFWAYCTIPDPSHIAGVMPTTRSSRSRQITEPLSKYVLIFGWLGFGRGGGLGGFGRFQFVDRVIPDRISFCRREALALHSTDMQELRSCEFCHYIECADQLRQIVSVEGADIVPASSSEHGARRPSSLHMLFGFLRQIPCAPNMPKDFFEPRAARCTFCWPISWQSRSPDRCCDQWTSDYHSDHQHVCRSCPAWASASASCHQ